jgi:hypothetical protein
VTQPTSPIAIDIDHHGAVVAGMLLATVGGGLAILVLGKPKPKLKRYGDAGGGADPPPGSFGGDAGGGDSSSW